MVKSGGAEDHSRQKNSKGTHNLRVQSFGQWPSDHMQFDIGNFPSLSWTDPVTALVELARMADRIGFDRFGISDWRYNYDCLTTMTACALATKRLKVESMVTDPFVRHPSLTACAIATLADLCGGRVVLGLSTGFRGQPPYWGKNRKKPHTALREAVHIIRAMWKGETVDFEGQVVKCQGARLRFPVRYDIPILIAGRSARTIELAGETADIIHFAPWSPSRERYIDNLTHARRGLEKSGRSVDDVEIDISVPTCVSDDAEKAFQSSKRYAAIAILWDMSMPKPPPNFSVPETLAESLSGWNLWAGKELPDRVDSLLTHDIVDQFTVSGTPKQVAQRYGEIMSYPDLGGIRIYTVPVEGKPLLEGYLETFRGLAAVLNLLEMP